MTTGNLTALTDLVDDGPATKVTERQPTPGIEEFCTEAAEILGSDGVIRDPSARE